MEFYIVLFTALSILVFILILAIIIVSYSLYQKSEQQRREITTLAQEIAFINKKLEKSKS